MPSKRIFQTRRVPIRSKASAKVQLRHLLRKTKPIMLVQNQCNRWLNSFRIALSRCEWKSRRIWVCLQLRCTWTTQQPKSWINYTWCRSKRRNKPVSRLSLSRRQSVMRCAPLSRPWFSWCRLSSNSSKPRPSKPKKSPTASTTVR